MAKKGGNTVGSKQNFDLKVMRGSGFGCLTVRRVLLAVEGISSNCVTLRDVFKVMRLEF